MTWLSLFMYYEEGMLPIHVYQSLRIRISTNCTKTHRLPPRPLYVIRLFDDDTVSRYKHSEFGPN
jgi:hypothetical protein